MSGFKMTRGTVVGGSTILLALLALLLVGLGARNGSAASASTGAAPAASGKLPPPPQAPSAFRLSDTYVAGSPAITPHAAQTAAGTSATIAPAGGAGAAFTRADVIAFFRQHGFFAGPVVAGAQLQVVAVRFVSAKQASQLMQGESVGRPDAAFVCYVKVRGPFLLQRVHHSAPPAGATNKAFPTTAEYGDAVFDAATGNLLVWGVYFP
jgi:hypothetical protein